MRKLTRACTALAAFAAVAVLPVTASATNNPRLTAPTGTFLPPKSAITASNIGHFIITDAETNVLLECATTSVSGTLAKNDHSGTEWTITAASFSGSTVVMPHGPSCGSFVVTTNGVNGLNYCWRSTPAMATDEFQIRGGGCGEPVRSISLVFHFSGPFGTCTYDRAEAIRGTFTTHPSPAVLNVAQAKFTRSSGFCPAELLLDTALALKSGANNVYIDDAT